ncbi:MAG TPA: YkvA family protein [Myxococcota bacterium]|nr:YkvA family protein [Myxococcota bacterium]
MPPLDRLTVTFTLGERDVRHLRGVAERAAARASQRPERAIASAARARAAELRKFHPPAYVLERVAGLEELIELLEDADWDPPERVRQRVRAALAYFTDPDDLIADSVPGLGFLDDAIVIELLRIELRHERAAFRAFTRYRDTARRWRAAGDLEWLAGKLAARRRLLRARVEARERSPVVRRWRGR